ncbi:MAG: GNAT family N-acetyltransferase [Myxococcales bacterium]|nr:GNAT family N-acetyltransferase [Myxococcales bacterium]
MPVANVTTERLKLRPVAPADGAALEALFADPVVRRWLLDDTIMPRAWIDEVIAQSEADFAARRCGLWRVGAAEGDALVGVVGYRDFFEPPVFEILWLLHPDHHGQGLAEEAVRAALRHGFEAGGLDPIRASTDAPNEASIRLAGRLGFQETGREPGPGGDTIHYALARAAFEAR